MKNNTFSLTVNKFGAFSVEFSTGAKLIQHNPENTEITSDITEHNEVISFSAKYGSNEFSVNAQIVGENEFEIRLSGEDLSDVIRYPAAWKSNENSELIHAMANGVCFKATEQFSETDMKRLFNSRPLFGGTYSSMACWVLSNSDATVISAAENGCDAKVGSGYIDSLLNTYIEWLPEKGKFGYTRVMRFFVTPNSDVPFLCKLYRNWREGMGFVRTLKEKAKINPNVEKLFGAADFWVFDDNTTNRLYGRDEVDGKVIDTLSVAKRMHQMGVDRLLVNSFESIEKPSVEKIKDLGFLTGRYDVYRDMIPADIAHLMLPFRLKQKEKHCKCWPDDIVVNADGSFKKAWALHGTDGNMYSQNAVCDISAERLTREEVPEYKELYGYNAWFIDVQCAGILNECYNERHPATRTDSKEAINRQNAFVLEDVQMVNGVEAGNEIFSANYCFQEGMMSPALFQAPDAGRNMDTLYYGEDIPYVLSDRMLNPKYRYPLWELIYHDCNISYWYWGDSSNCCPELIGKRDALNMLYGTPPLYTSTMSQFETLKDIIVESYKRVSPLARRVATSKMVSFERLTDDMNIQQTKFDNGITVVANFSDEIYVHSSGKTVPANGAVWWEE